MCYYYINSFHITLYFKNCCDVTLKLLWAILRPPCNVCFSFFLSFSFSPSLSPFVSWIDFAFVLDSSDAQCWFLLCGSCFIACSMFVYCGILQFHSARGSPRAGHIPVSAVPSPPQRWTRKMSDLFPKTHKWCPHICKYCTCTYRKRILTVTHIFMNTLAHTPPTTSTLNGCSYITLQ